jgi:drug/metabolite transporter (DMT)-like permease
MIVLPLNPITAMLTGALLLAEPVSVELLAGLALVIIGIMLVVGLPGSAVTERSALETPPP